MTNDKIRQKITNKIIELMEKEGLKWIKTWGNIHGINWTTEKPYKGINILLTWIGMHQGDYTTNEWLTFCQIRKANGKLKKGSKGIEIIYWEFKEMCSCKNLKCKEPESENHIKKKIPMIRTYYVFNIECTDLNPRNHNNNMKIEESEQILKAYWPENKIRYGNPAYIPILDKIQMPNIQQFTTTEEYYSALTHELIHSTGSKERLNRIGITNNKADRDNTYAYEELIAELGSIMLCTHLNLKKNLESSAAYIKGWLKLLQSDNSYIFKAASKADEAKEFILKNEKTNTEIQETEQIPIEI